MKTALNLLCFFCGYLGGLFAVRCPPAPTSSRLEFGHCASTCPIEGCGPGRECCPTTACGGSSCVGVEREPWLPWWCPNNQVPQCIVIACQFMTCPAVPWAQCIHDNPCDGVCTGNFYVGRYRIPRWICNSRRG